MKRKVDWDKYEVEATKRRERSYRALVNKEDIIKTAAEDAVHWNRMYREQLEQYDELLDELIAERRLHINKA